MKHILGHTIFIDLTLSDDIKFIIKRITYFFVKQKWIDRSIEGLRTVGIQERCVWHTDGHDQSSTLVNYFILEKFCLSFADCQYHSKMLV
jgi:hypothetical protein